MTARSELVALLTAALPGYKIIPTMQTIDRVQRKTLMVWIESMRHSGIQGTRDNTASVLVFEPGQTGKDDQLDESIEHVLHVLNGHSVLSWDTAERQVFDEKFPCYKITLTIQTKE
jgi:hypothetical protein